MQLRNRAVGARAAAVVVSGAVVRRCLRGGARRWRRRVPFGPRDRPGRTGRRLHDHASAPSRRRSPPSRSSRRSCGRRVRPVCAASTSPAGNPRRSAKRTTRARARITAIAVDDDGGTWVASAAGLGRWVAAGDDLRYEPKGTPGAVNASRRAGRWRPRASGPAGRAASTATTAASFPASTASARSPCRRSCWTTTARAPGSARSRTASITPKATTPRPCRAARRSFSMRCWASRRPRRARASSRGTPGTNRGSTR